MAGIKKSKNKTKAYILRYAPKDVAIPKRLGGGKLKELVEQEMPSGKVLRYSLAYINSSIFSGDNGRVIGYDNSHGAPHKHYMGQMTFEPFVTWEHLRTKFEAEWREIATKFVNGEQI